MVPGAVSESLHIGRTGGCSLVKVQELGGAWPRFLHVSILAGMVGCYD